jgi:hypothetical protein
MVTMKERGVIFTGSSVRAIIGGRKTQTRRVLKGLAIVDRGSAALSPFGARGDVLWVRESLAKDSSSCWCYAADLDPIETRLADHYARAAWQEDVARRQRTGAVSSRHMPRWASRITLKITDIRAQRVQDITEEDAIAEGITRGTDGWWNGATHPIKGNPKALPSARDAYATLWDEINGKRDAGRFSWSRNPWVWCVSFARVLP